MLGRETGSGYQQGNCGDVHDWAAHDVLRQETHRTCTEGVKETSIALVDMVRVALCVTLPDVRVRGGWASR